MQIRTETIVGIFVATALAVFLYMSFQVGVFRLDWRDYLPYTIYFKDISGLQKKAEVKIAGVKVGWVESTELVPNEERAKAIIMVNKKFELHADAYAVVRQEGLLGSKYLELVPGDPMLPNLASGDTLGRPGKPPVNVDELFQKFKVIATNVEDITTSLKEVVGTNERDQLKAMMSNFELVASRLADASDSIDRLVTRNEDNLSGIITNFKDFTGELRTGWPNIQNKVEDATGSIHQFATKMASTAEAIEDAANQARDSIRSFGDVADKINEGRGLIGKLVTEDETYNDIRTAVSGLKNYFAKVERLGVVFDAYSEMMWGTAETFNDHLDRHIRKRDAKGYFGFRLHPSEDHFYVLQAVASRKGYVERYTQLTRFSTEVGAWPHMDACVGVPQPVELAYTTTKVQLYDPAAREVTVQHRGGRLKFNLQMAKIFKDMAFRFGLFENSAGMGLDYDIPFRSEKFRWITSLELYDFFGDDRINDQRPHVKWLNRVFWTNNFYMSFGADDFISRHNANAFAGCGLRFADDDIKYLASKFSSVTGTQ